MDEEDTVHVHNGILLRHQEKKKGIMPFSTTWMDLEILILSEMSDTER